MGAKTSRRPKRVLVADDTAFVCDRFSAAIEAAGHHAVVVRTAPQLLSHVRDPASDFDLIVLDLHLPRGRGVSLLHDIRRLASESSIAVFSGTIASADEVRQLDAMGVAGYVNEYTADQFILRTIEPHLHAEHPDRRSSPRVVLGVPVSYRVGNRVAAALTVSLSRGGLAIRTTSPQPVGTPLAVRFTLPGPRRSEITARARVAWVTQRLGMGLQFTSVSPTDQTRIDDYVHSHFFSNRKA